MNKEAAGLSKVRRYHSSMCILIFIKHIHAANHLQTQQLAVRLLIGGVHWLSPSAYRKKVFRAAVRRQHTSVRTLHQRHKVTGDVCVSSWTPLQKRTDREVDRVSSGPDVGGHRRVHGCVKLLHRHVVGCRALPLTNNNNIYRKQ